MVELATLERWYTRKGIVGSNPTLSAMKREKPNPIPRDRLFLFHRSSGLVFCVMFDDLCVNEKDDIFCNIGGMVGKPLQMPGQDHHMCSGFDL